MKWWDWCHDLSFFECWALNQCVYSSSFTCIKRLFNSSSLSAIRMMPSAYLMLLVLLLANIIPDCATSSQAFPVMQSEYILNKQGDNTQPWHAPFPILNQSIVSCLVLTVASWPANRFLNRQVRWSGIPIFKNFLHFVVIHTVKGFSIINEEVDVSFWNPLAFSMIQQNRMHEMEVAHIKNVRKYI